MLRATNRPVLAYFDGIKSLHLSQVALVLKSGYDPNLLVNGRGQNGLQFMINYFGGTDARFRLQAPLNKAAYLGIARLLLESGLDANSVDLFSGETVVFDAIRYNDRDMVSLLLDHVDFSIRNKDGDSVLMCAARFGSRQVMRMLLDHLRQLQMDGFFLRQRNRFGFTPLELARAENLECAKVLTKHLIDYGQHTNAVLSRSSSHHQLCSMPAYELSQRQQLGPISRTSKDFFAGDDDFNDETSDLDKAYYNRQLLMARRGPLERTAPGKLAASHFYDPRAANFSRYLLEQQSFDHHQQQQQQQHQNQQKQSVMMNSDENSDLSEPFEGRYFGPTGGSMLRTRSCVLSQTTGQASKPRTQLTGGQKLSESKH